MGVSSIPLTAFQRQTVSPASNSHPNGSRDRHEAAVASTLRLADEAAAGGDYQDALTWLVTLEAIGDQIPDEYERKREVWARAQRATVADEVSQTRADAAEGSYLRCPRCGLGITPRAQWLTVEHCPRCLARHGTAVAMRKDP